MNKFWVEIGLAKQNAFKVEVEPVVLCQHGIGVFNCGFEVDFPRHFYVVVPSMEFHLLLNIVFKF